MNFKQFHHVLDFGHLFKIEFNEDLIQLSNKKLSICHDISKK
jgi:hypothetical protein